MDGSKDNCYTCSSPFRKEEKKIPVKGVPMRFVHSSYEQCSAAMGSLMKSSFGRDPSPRHINEAE